MHVFENLSVDDERFKGPTEFWSKSFGSDDSP